MRTKKVEREGQRHVDALIRSVRLTELFYRMYRPGRVMLSPAEIIAVLNDAGVGFVLMGAHGIGGWRNEPRSTDDIDFLIEKRHHDKAVAAITKAYPHLTVLDHSVVTRFVDPETQIVVLDLMKPYEPFLQAVFKNTVPAGRTHRVPDLEMALVCKFAAMMSTQRVARKRHADAADFGEIVAENSDQIDVTKLRRLARKIQPDYSKKIVAYLEDARAGRVLKLEG